MNFRAVLNSHEELFQRREHSRERLALVKEKIEMESYFEELGVAVFCAGSLARLEARREIRLDLFVTADDDPKLRSRLCEYTLFAHLIRSNEELSFPPFSNDGEYLKIHFLEDLKKGTGSRRDDSENLFTVRMLLMLKSEPDSRGTIPPTPHKHSRTLLPG